MATRATTNVNAVSTAIEKALNECGVQAIAKLPAFEQAIRMAQGIRALREALTDEFVQSTLLPLQGNALGFLTDKDATGGYGVFVVRDCSIEAMLRGFNVVGNEFNIIAGRFYGTKAGFDRKVNEFPGLRALELSPGVPVMKDGGALVPYSATWLLGGKAMSLHCQLGKGIDGETTVDGRIPVRVNANMGADAIIGKATRKMLARIYHRLNGGTFGLSDGEVDEEPILTTGEPAPPPVPAGTPEGKRVRLGKTKAEPAKAPAAAPAGAAPPPAPAGNVVPISPPPRPVEPVDIVELHEALSEADRLWRSRGTALRIKQWSEPERRAALEWARAVNEDGPMSLQASRPAHTMLEDDDAEDGEE
jgi:hypothetical protein